MDFDPFVSRGLQFREYDVAHEGNSATVTVREKGCLRFHAYATPPEAGEI